MDSIRHHPQQDHQTGSSHPQPNGEPPTLRPVTDTTWQCRVKGIGMSVWLAVSTLLGCCYCLFPLMPLAWMAPSLFRHAMDVIIGFWFVMPVTLVEHLFSLQLRITGDRVDSRLPSLIMMNHRTRLDWFFLWLALFRLDPWLITTEKISLKRVLKLIPGAGWAMALNAYMFLERIFERDGAKIDETIDYYKRVGGKYQLLFFPEGTDKCIHMTEKSHRFAQQHGLKKYEYVLHPRTTGFVHLVQKMRREGYLACVYDVTVAYSHSIVQSEIHLFTHGLCPRAVHFHIRRIPFTELPQSDDELAAWAKSQWAKKEEQLSEFYSEPSAKLRGFPGLPAKNKYRQLQLAIVGFWVAATIAWIYLLVAWWWYQVWFVATALAFYVGTQMVYGGVEALYMRVRTETKAE